MESFKTTLKLMKETIVCPICKEFYRTPVVITACSHNFCSICIRRYFTIKQECPVCGVDVLSDNLVPNRVIETMIKHYECLSGFLDNQVKRIPQKFVPVRLKEFSGTSSANPTVVNSIMEPSVVIDRLELPNSSSSMSRSSSPDDCFVVDSSPAFSLGLKDFCTQSQGFSMESQPTKNRTSNESHDMFTDPPQITEKIVVEEHALPGVSVEESSASNISVRPDEADDVRITGTNSTGLESPNAGKADCPVCGTPVLTAYINSHLDGCLAREEKKKALRQNTSKRMKRNKPQITKLAYNLLSLRDLRSKLKEIGLPTKGDKAELKRRHQEFLAKYQAEQDKVDPRCTDALITELSRDEARRKQFETKTSPKKLTFSPQSEEKLGRQDHMEKYAKQYRELEEQARKSLPKRQGNKRRLEDSSDDDNSKPGCSYNYCDKVQVNVINDVSLQNSSTVSLLKDSDEICPDSQCSFSSPVDCIKITASISDAKADSRSVSPELYANASPQENSDEKSSTLKNAIEADSQCDDIKQYIDASLE